MGSSERTTRYAVLLGLLLAVILLAPFVRETVLLSWIASLAILGIVGASILSCWRRSGILVVLLVLGFVSQIGSIVGEAADMSYAIPCGHGVRFAFLLLIAATVFREILSVRTVTMNAILGACCVYLLMGLGWASIYSLIEWSYPGSFELPTLMGDHAVEALDGRFVYFSLITLTAVGFGDITPIGPHARTMAALEGLIGQLFLTVIIARMVGLEIASRLESR